jgi:hypothetical protein
MSTLMFSRVLRRVTFTGSSKYFDQFECFFIIFGLTIESLVIHMDLMFSTIDGQQLEHALLKRMPRLLSLDLILHSTAVYTEPINMDRFRTELWQHYSPIVYWYDIRAHQQIIFTLPYRCERVSCVDQCVCHAFDIVLLLQFKYLSNESISSWICNRSVSLCFAHVRSLSLCATTPLTLQTCQSIERIFPRLQSLDVTNPFRVSGLDPTDQHSSSQSYMNEDLLDDRTLQLPSVTKFSLLSTSYHDDYRTFCRLLDLLPNLNSLQMIIGRPLFRQILAHEYQDTHVRKQCLRIKLLQMIRFFDEKTVLTDEEIHYLFPNAIILFDYDDL